MNFMTDPARIAGILAGAGLAAAFWWRVGPGITARLADPSSRTTC